MFNRKVWLPRTPEDFELLVDKVVNKFKLTDRNHATALISNAISHIPNDQAQTTIDYLGHTVLKNLANYIADFKRSVLRHEAQVKDLYTRIQQEPTNQQAWDELTKASNEGSALAKEYLNKLESLQNQQGKSDDASNVVAVKT